MKSNCKTLVIRFSSVGDIVLSTPLLRVLRKRFPDGQIDYVTKKEFAELVRSNHNLNVTYEYDTSTGFSGFRQLRERIRNERYDLIVDIHNSLRSRYLRAFQRKADVLVVNKRQLKRFLLVRFKKNLYEGVVSVADRYIEPLRKFGIENDGKGLELHIPDELLFAVSGKIAKLKLNKFERVVGLCPSSRHFTKRWLDDRFVSLGIEFTRRHSAKILIFGGPEDTMQCSQIARFINGAVGEGKASDLSGVFSLLETAAAMQFCDVIVTNDSGLMHVAAAMHKKLVAIFGSTVKEFGFFPVGTQSVIVERNGLYCRPCSHIGRPSCPEGHFRCMKEIIVDEVFEKSSALLVA